MRLNFDNMLEIYKSGYTRIPVYDTHPQAIIGILYTKDLILVDPGASCGDAALTLWPKLSQELAGRNDLAFIADACQGWSCGSGHGFSLCCCFVMILQAGTLAALQT